MQIHNQEIRGLCKSFVYAFRGLWYCIKNERNMRIHITAGLLILLFSFAYDLTRMGYAVLILTIGMVMVCELINTAIEALVNLGSPAYDSLARIAKDVAAGAVLLCAMAAVCVAVALFGQPDKLRAAVHTIVAHPWYLALFFVVAVLGILFIFKGFGKRPRRSRSADEVKLYQPQKNAHSTSFDAPQTQADVKIYHPKGEQSGGGHVKGS